MVVMVIAITMMLTMLIMMIVQGASVVCVCVHMLLQEVRGRTLTATRFRSLLWFKRILGSPRQTIERGPGAHHDPVLKILVFNLTITFRDGLGLGHALNKVRFLRDEAPAYDTLRAF